MYRKNFPGVINLRREGALERLQLQLVKDPKNERIKKEIIILQERIKAGRGV